MAAPLNTFTTIEQRGVVRFLWAKGMAAKETSIYICQRTQRHILENNIGPTLLLILRLWNLKKCGVD
jgi:hypothetical protein